MDQIENYGADYNSREVPQIIIEKIFMELILMKELYSLLR
jgi:hypothetical protein